MLSYEGVFFCLFVRKHMDSLRFYAVGHSPCCMSGVALP